MTSHLESEDSGRFRRYLREAIARIELARHEAAGGDVAATVEGLAVFREHELPMDWAYAAALDQAGYDLPGLARFAVEQGLGAEELASPEHLERIGAPRRGSAAVVGTS